MDIEDKLTVEKGFADINGRLDEGAKRFDRVEKKIDARAEEFIRLETQMSQLRRDHDLLDSRVDNQDAAIESCMGVIDKMEARDRARDQRDQQKQIVDDGRHTANLESINGVRTEVKALVNKPQPGFLSPDMPITIKFVLWVGGVLMVGGNAVIVWYTVLRPMMKP